LWSARSNKQTFYYGTCKAIKINNPHCFWSNLTKKIYPNWRLLPNSGKSRDFRQIVENLKTLSYLDFFCYALWTGLWTNPIAARFRLFTYVFKQNWNRPSSIAAKSMNAGSGGRSCRKKAQSCGVVVERSRVRCVKLCTASAGSVERVPCFYALKYHFNFFKLDHQYNSNPLSFKSQIWSLQYLCMCIKRMGVPHQGDQMRLWKMAQTVAQAVFMSKGLLTSIPKNPPPNGLIL
jgi:hypothetical protein